MVKTGDPITDEQREQVEELCRVLRRFAENLEGVLEGQNWRGLDSQLVYTPDIVRAAEAIGLPTT